MSLRIVDMLGLTDATGAIHPRTCYHPRSCFLCDRLGYGCGAHRVGDPGHADCTGEASPAEAIALAYGLDQ